MQQLQKGICVGFQLLERLALDTRYDACDNPARQANLNHGDQRMIHVSCHKGPAQVIGPALLRLPHGGLHGLVKTSVDGCRLLADRPIGSSEEHARGVAQKVCSYPHSGRTDSR